MLYDFTVIIEIELKLIFGSSAELILLVIFLLLLWRYYKGLHMGFLF